MKKNDIFPSSPLANPLFGRYIAKVFRFSGSDRGGLLFRFSGGGDTFLRECRAGENEIRKQEKGDSKMKMKHALLLLLAAVLAMPLFAGEPVRRIFVTRHGQPGVPSTNPSLVSGDPALTDLGREQATLLGIYLKSQKFNGKMYASPYCRTVDTAVQAAKENGCKVIPDARFQERVSDHRKGKDVPNTPNLSKCHTIEMFKQMFPGMIDENAVLAENWLLTEPEDYRTTHAARLMKGLEEVMKEQPEGDILIASHAGAVLGLTLELHKRAGFKKEPTGTRWNCCLFTYGVDKDGKISYLGYTVKFMPDEKITSNKKYKKHTADPEYQAKKAKKAKREKKSE